jgi:phage-related holin
MHGGVFNYSPFLLRFGYLPISMHAALPGAWIADIAFIASLALLPAPVSALDVAARTAGAVSTAVIFALETANIDTVMFVLTMLSVTLLRRGTIFRLCAYGIFTFLAALKFYPVFPLILALRERKNNLLWIAAAGILCAAAFLFCFFGGVKTAFEILPFGPPFGWMFGAINLPEGIALLLFVPVLTVSPTAAQYFRALDQKHSLLTVLWGLKILAIIAILTALPLTQLYDRALKKTSVLQGLLLITGAAVTVGCFFIAQNVDYRAIFLILTIPGLSAMAACAAGRMRLLLRFLVGAIIFLMWESLFRLQIAALSSSILPPAEAVFPQIAFWLFREILWWFVIIQLLAILFAFAWSNIKRLAAMPPAINRL